MARSADIAVWLVGVINHCMTREQIGSARNLVKNYERLYGDTYPLMRFVLQREFEIVNTQSA